MVTAIKGEKKLKSAGLQPEKRKKIQRQKDLFQADKYSIWAGMILLVAFGLMMIYSASGYRFAGSSAHRYDSMYLLKRQIIFAGTGVAACFFGQYLNYRLLNKKIFAVAIYSRNCFHSFTKNKFGSQCKWGNKMAQHCWYTIPGSGNR